MKFISEKDKLVVRNGHETIQIEPWGKNSLRVRGSKYPRFSNENWALEQPDPAVQEDIQVEIFPDAAGASITNGRIKAVVNGYGVLSFYKDDKRVLHEYRRNYDGSETNQCIALKIDPREYKANPAGDYKITVRFEGNDKEKLFGMGQYQEPYMDLKGCTLEMGQRNSQVSVPFVLSNMGYGLLWNNPGIGRATFAKNMSEIQSYSSKEIDYWITADDTPKEIIENYTAMTGRAPDMPEDLLGLWQCRLRYRTQQEVLDVARRYHELGRDPDVIIIDYFHWIRQGDWGFDPEYWPDVKAMCDELHSYGTKVMVSIWPNVDRKSIHYGEMLENGYLMQTERGPGQTYDYQGDCTSIDVFNPDARKYLFDICKENYLDNGIDMFWLDNIEPDMAVYDYDNIRFYEGTDLAIGNRYPQYFVKAFYDGLKDMGQEDVVLLTRSGWVGNAKYGSLMWSGDVQSNFDSLKTQVMQGLNMGIAGFPWWTTDIGGFMTDDAQDPKFKELLVRWFEYAVFSPIVRLHGTRGPLDVPYLDTEKDYGGGFSYTGHGNEIWSFGEETQAILEKFLDIRNDLKPYLKEIYKQASETGLPLMRAMFVEFPKEAASWECTDQYMLGDKLLVAPVLEENARSRQVFFPKGVWKDFFSDKILESEGEVIEIRAGLDEIPVFERMF